MEYTYLWLKQSEVNIELNRLAREGWRVNSFNRVPGSGNVDILLERQRRKPKSTAPRGKE